jgi:hypothetical protein
MGGPRAAGSACHPPDVNKYNNKNNNTQMSNLLPEVGNKAKDEDLKMVIMVNVIHNHYCASLKNARSVLITVKNNTYMEAQSS